MKYWKDAAMLEELKLKFRRAVNKSVLDQFNILIEAKRLEDFTMSELAKHFEINESTAYKILTLRKANANIIAKIKNNYIAASKVILILNSSKASMVEDLVMEAIKNKYTYRDLETIVFKDHKYLKYEKAYKNVWNISRDLKNYCKKLELSLIRVEDIPKHQKKIVKESLEKVRPLIEKALASL